MKKNILKKYVRAFDNSHGMPQSVFGNVYVLLENELGRKSAEVFSKNIQATEGAFYLKEGTFMSAWKDILRVAEPMPNGR